MTYRCTWEAVDPGRRKDVEKINAHLNERAAEGWNLNATTAGIGSGVLLHTMFWVRD